MGPSDSSFHETVSAIFISDDSVMNTIMWSIRIPRIMVSLVAGSCLGLAGALIQISSRSPLGDPNLFGIGGGAAIFIAACSAGLLVLDGFWIFAGCISFAVIVSILLSQLIATKDLSPIKLAIMGIALGSLTVSISTAVISHGRVFSIQVIGLVAGSFAASNWETFYYMVATLGICAGVSFFLSRKFQPIMLGDTLSKSLGVNPVSTRLTAMILVGILTGASVYGGGIIGFVGLISPHLARRLFGNFPSKLILGSIIIGALLTIFSDQVARLIFAPTELPVGMATTIIGAPMMMYLAMRIR
tara:strand:+ start:5800 stop:6702 length:903 start_codon:yes stop_codon:yes gene_type:complete